MNVHLHYSRRDVLRIGAALVLGTASSSSGLVRGASSPALPSSSYVIRDADEAVAKLLDGNKRYVANQQSMHPRRSAERRTSVTEQQTPFAAILGCSDSRVPTEILFDQGLGDLFVVRVAGHVVDAATLGSIEYAVAGLGVSLVLVLGHERCGAVQAAMTMLDAHRSIPEYFKPIATKIQAAIETTKDHSGDRLGNAVRENVRHVVKQLEQVGSVLHRSIEQEGVKVIGAKYDLDVGKVTVVS